MYDYLHMFTIAQSGKRDIGAYYVIDRIVLLLICNCVENM